MNTHDLRESASGRLLTLSYVALLTGQIISILGDRLNNIAMIELIAQETGRFARSGSTLEMSKLFVAVTLPSLILGPVVGAYVDRVSRKRTLILTDLIRGLVVAVVPFMRPALPLWTVYVMVAVLYVANLFFLPARCAVVSEIVPRDRLLRANSGLTLGATSATILGFLFGGVIAAKAGWRAALWIDSVTYFISAAALGFIRPASAAVDRKEEQRVSYAKTMKQALDVVRRSTAARLGVVAPATLVLAGTTAYVLGVAMIERNYAGGTMYVGFVTAAAGLGMAVGSLLTGTLFHGRHRARIMRTWVPIVIAPLAVLAVTRNPVLIGIGVALAGFAAGPVFVSSETAVQEEAPTRRQATVFAFRDMLMKVSALLAAWLAGLSPALIGERKGLVALLATWLVVWLAIRGRNPDQRRPRRPDATQDDSGGAERKCSPSSECSPEQRGVTERKP
jgi:DHA3 family macrolide efflux protein-like MFS transporter